MSRRWRTKGLLTAAAVSAICAGTLWAKPGTVHTLDNGAFTGDVTEQGQYVVITVHGIQTRLDRRNVRFPIEYTASVDDQYELQHAKLSPEDVKGREQLADFALQNNRPDLAVKALTEASTIAPTSREVSLALQSAQKQVELDRTGKPAPHGPDAGPTPAAPGTAADVSKPKMPEHRQLTQAEVNKIRQYELPADDMSVHVRFDNNVVAKYVADNNLDLSDFRKMDPVKQAQTILAGGDAKMAEDVHIMTDPAPIVQFKTKVLPIIMAGCASSGCHGSSHAGSFGLYVGQSPSVVYTNFYILQTYAKSFKKTQYMAMDRNYPDRSLVLQFAIPANQATVTHPAEPGYRPRYKGPTDPSYKAVYDWITSLKPIEPQYGIDVSPSIPATQPADATPEKSE